MKDSRSGAARFGAAIAELHSELDWELLGGHYCEGDGSSFFSGPDREAVLESGLLLADDLAGVLATAGAGGSLYVGAALAELAPILCEQLVLEREVHWHNLPGPESDELNRALAAVSRRLTLELPRVEVNGFESLAPGSCDHAWLVSVLTDPECFPALHDRLYDRSGPQATGRGDVEHELLRTSGLLDDVLRRLRAPCVFTTSDEEVDLVREACGRRGWTLDVPPAGRLSGVVGDVVRVCRIVEYAVGS